MFEWKSTLDKFILQANLGDLKTASYQKEYNDLRLRVSFGMGTPARVPWIAFVLPIINVSNGFYPVYLYYKDLGTLILAYGLSETHQSNESWPAEVMNSSQTISSFFDKTVPRYGDSFVFRSYEIEIINNEVRYTSSESKELLTEKDIGSDLRTIIEYYKKTTSSTNLSSIVKNTEQGLFYMEKQLEDFIIHNWDSIDLGKKYELMIEDGELLSQQFRTEIGPIDILVRNKVTKDYVVIELKKNQTSDDTIGQIARYMGWVKENKGGNVSGIIIAGEYDKRLDFALKVMTNVEVFLYEVNFKLNKFSK